MTTKLTSWTALFATMIGCSIMIGCSEAESASPAAACRAYASRTAILLSGMDPVTRAHGEWVDRLATAEPPYERAHAAEQDFRQRCQSLGEGFSDAGADLRREARLDSPLDYAAARTEHAGDMLRATCIGLLQGNLDDDPRARDAALSSAMDEVREAINEVKELCELPSTE